MNYFVYFLVSWTESIVSVIQPIQEDILNRKNPFSGSLREKNQDEYIAPFLFSLISMLIGGEVNIESKCSKADVSVAKGKSLDYSDFVDTVQGLKKLTRLPAKYTDRCKVYLSFDNFCAPLCKYNFNNVMGFSNLASAKNIDG